jgi:hypothetical protein
MTRAGLLFPVTSRAFVIPYEQPLPFLPLPSACHPERSRGTCSLFVLTRTLMPIIPLLKRLT